jgi:IS1 family transposase
MNQLSTSERAQVIRALVEGNSINSTVRMTGISKLTILKLIAEFGAACQKFHDERVVGLNVNRLQCDEIWAFCYCKKMNVTPEMEGKPGFGDCWTWTAIDSDSKLMVHWMVGQRDGRAAYDFMHGVAPRIGGRVQITTDGLHAYKSAIGICFDVEKRSDYAQCVKLYGDEIGQGKYSPGECTGVEVKVCWGDPDPDHISTSHVERSNLTLRMGMRRYTRLTNGFSKKIENHGHMTTIFLTYYNWCRRHMSLTKCTPAMAAGLTDHKWEIEELIDAICE